MGAIEQWANDPRVLEYMSTHDPRGVVENGDYIRAQKDWGKGFEELHPNGTHLRDGGLAASVNPLPYGKLLNHPTLSSESPFAEGKGGEWTKGHNGSWTFTPSEWMKQNHNMQGLAEYFKRAERGNVLNLVVR